MFLCSIDSQEAVFGESGEDGVLLLLLELVFVFEDQLPEDGVETSLLDRVDPYGVLEPHALPPDELVLAEPHGLQDGGDLADDLAVLPDQHSELGELEAVELDDFDLHVFGLQQEQIPKGLLEDEEGVDEVHELESRDALAAGDDALFDEVDELDRALDAEARVALDDAEDLLEE